ncbi:hypothetical protein OCK74_18780 [Chitinophagaceae bacterium LB-8]|uniref:Uncharacterized protein n=1 Tax=Paraflavisolibacter caeni TaxID=2982496 RepID=A0A9X2XPF1_9BACT|nr:hypothetical protein [Paraflavisolibacter caeni]MCU7551173.1 hypothetical protein [Paraflavisolibacter caeni]
MKKILVLIAILFATNAFGQSTNDKDTRVVIDSKKAGDNDTGIKVIYVDKIYADKISNMYQPAYFINDKLVSQTLVATLNPGLIESVHVVKGSLQINNREYDGQIHIKTKSLYNPKLISLNALKEKYTNLKGKSAIFMLDGNIVNADYDNYEVDENYLLAIIVDKVENLKENIHLGLIKILTKSEENIKKMKEIRIRGAEVPISK